MPKGQDWQLFTTRGPGDLETEAARRCSRLGAHLNMSYPEVCFSLRTGDPNERLASLTISI
eukprot:scaffold172916_cov20-Prasinocladus_malaysianus.AAC.1